MMDWKLQTILAFIGGLFVLIVGAGWKSYRNNDLPSVKESGITFVVGAVSTAVLSFMGGFDSWVPEITSLAETLTKVQSGGSTESPKESAPEFSSMVGKVGESVKSVTSWFQADGSSAGDDEMLVGPMPF